MGPVDACRAAGRKLILWYDDFGTKPFRTLLTRCALTPLTPGLWDLSTAGGRSRT